MTACAINGIQFPCSNKTRGRRFGPRRQKDIMTAMQAARKHVTVCQTDGMRVTNETSEPPRAAPNIAKHENRIANLPPRTEQIVHF